VPDVLVAGASGFAGALAARLVQQHPEFHLRAVTSRSDAGRRLSELYPHHRVDLVLEPIDLDEHANVDAAIVGYPHGASAELVAQLHERGVRVVDLSADFRLRDLPTYVATYGDHAAPQLIPEAVYGLPELYREQLRDATLVAGPGCFPTAALLGLAPLARAGLVRGAVIDAKTGVSGAGRAATDTTHFVSIAENVKPYKVGAHRHTPEMEQELAVLGADVAVSFTPHLIPIDQGELVSAYVDLAAPADQVVLDALFRDAYADEPFVEVVDAPPGVRDVRETNMCRIHAYADERTGRAQVFAAIDNLWKGTSSQAIQSLNLMFGYDEQTGLS
jgi:N-acetyl-gamma-glutamyl-phosphate reductase